MRISSMIVRNRRQMQIDKATRSVGLKLSELLSPPKGSKSIFKVIKRDRQYASRNQRKFD